MRYIVRKEGTGWIVRGECGHFYAGRKTHADAIDWADMLATNPARHQITSSLHRIRTALGRMEG